MNFFLNTHIDCTQCLKASWYNKLIRILLSIMRFQRMKTWWNFLGKFSLSGGRSEIMSLQLPFFLIKLFSLAFQLYPSPSLSNCIRKIWGITVRNKWTNPQQTSIKRTQLCSRFSFKFLWKWQLTNFPFKFA